MADVNPDMTYDLCILLLHGRIRRAGRPLTRDEAISYLVDDCHFSGDLALSIMEDIVDSGDLDKLNKGESPRFRTPIFLFKKSEFFGLAR